MTDKQRMYCLSEASNYADRDAYISDLSLSSVWCDAEDAEIPSERIESLGRLWDAYHRSTKDICALAGLSQKGFSERFCIPYRTVCDWCTGSHTPPDYVKIMIQQLLGLL